MVTQYYSVSALPGFTDAPAISELEGRHARFLVKLGRALHRYGTPSHGLEEKLGQVAQHLGLEARFFATPTATFAAVRSDDRERTHLIRVAPAELDLGRLQDTTAIVDRVLADRCSVVEGERELDAVLDAPPRYGAWTLAACSALASAGAALILGGGPVETAVAGALGIGVAGLRVLAQRQPRLDRLVEPISGWVAAVVTAAVATLAPHASHLALVAGLIVLLPGLTLTLAMTEIVTGHLVSGTARLTGARRAS
jgi:uncharacterized membrane protein YjjP (DUF1212 family)